MKIAFLCSSLEPGRDGVGDYCRRLAAELTARGAETMLIGLNDLWVQGSQSAHDESNRELRFPRGLPIEERVRLARSALESFGPDWVSLQYVAYGFHPKGLPWQWNHPLDRIAGSAARHLMLHELWIGQSPAPWRHRLLGKFQRLIVKSLVRQFCPAQVQVSIPLFQSLLAQVDIAAQANPLFGNIPLATSDPESFYSILKDAGLTLSLANRENYLVGVLFGTIHPGWNPEPLLDLLKKAAASTGQRLCLIAVGRIGVAGQQIFDAQSKSSGGAVHFICLGERSPAAISQLLHGADFGLNTGAYCLLGKSGTFAAMKEHGLPVIMARPEAKPDLQEPITTEPIHFLTEALVENLVKGLPKGRVYSGAGESATRLLALLGAEKQGIA